MLGDVVGPLGVIALSRIPFAGSKWHLKYNHVDLQINLRFLGLAAHRFTFWRPFRLYFSRVHSGS